MRLKHISVTGLFRIFDHEVPLNVEDRITIIHGLNGFGKTILLRMVHGALTGSLMLFRSVSFTRFALTFDDGSSLRIEKASVVDPKIQASHALLLTLTTAGEHATVQSFFVARSIAEANEMRMATRLKVGKTPVRWNEELRRLLSVRLIETQRLSQTHRNAVSGKDETVLAVQRYSEELAAKIESTLASYAARSQELDRTFPARLIEQSQFVLLSSEELQRKLAELEERRGRLTELGLLDPEQDLGPTPRTDDPTKLSVLSIYIQDVEEKLAVFDELAAKIGLLLDIANARFRYKKLTIRRKHGLTFTARDGGPLPVTALSSGEQHELVMLYELLFKVPRDSLILIDEPEISLHLTWQQEFLSDLKKMVALSGFDVIIATHSADIIGEDWGLTVQLQGPPT